MNAAADMLAAVRRMGGDVMLASPGRLKVIAPTPLPDELIQQLRAVKPDLFTLLAPTTQPVDPWTDAEEERAAIVEYDGGAPRDWAEALARLNADKPPRHVPPKRWLRFIDDCGRFLDGGWADKAAAFGWGPLDLFGCDRKRYYASPRGLLWDVNGGTVVALSHNLAIIEIEGGTRRAYKREPVEVGRVILAWELTP
jgi:hypothetical protein